MSNFIMLIWKIIQLKIAIFWLQLMVDMLYMAECARSDLHEPWKAKNILVSQIKFEDEKLKAIFDEDVKNAATKQSHFETQGSNFKFKKQTKKSHKYMHVVIERIFRNNI